MVYEYLEFVNDINLYINAVILRIITNIEYESIFKGFLPFQALVSFPDSGAVSNEYLVKFPNYDDYLPAHLQFFGPDQTKFKTVDINVSSVTLGNKQ